jgi:hypothetical protein
MALQSPIKTALFTDVEQASRVLEFGRNHGVTLVSYTLWQTRKSIYTWHTRHLLKQAALWFYLSQQVMHYSLNVLGFALAGTWYLEG